MVDGRQFVEFSFIHMGCQRLRWRNVKIEEIKFCWFMHERTKYK